MSRGAGVTSYPTLQPWALLAYITGFHDRLERLKFEAHWKETCRRRLKQHDSPEKIIFLAHDLLKKENMDRNASSLLRLVRCGHITSTMTMISSTSCLIKYLITISVKQHGVGAPWCLTIFLFVFILSV